VFILVRDGHAGHQRQWDGRDLDRPLSERGQQQAQGLLHNLSALDPPRLLSSPYLRCRQTLAPLAEHNHVRVETLDVLGPDTDIAVLDRFLGEPQVEGAVLCTHGSVLRQLLTRWRERNSVTFTDTLATSTGPGPEPGTTEKGGTWIIVDTGDGRTAHYLRPLHVGPVLALNPAPDEDEPDVPGQSPAPSAERMTGTPHT
jgi:phosphohistidine phosphatase SixA